jgi:hypothetical protein
MVMLIVREISIGVSFPPLCIAADGFAVSYPAKRDEAQPWATDERFQCGQKPDQARRQRSRKNDHVPVGQALGEISQ